MKGHRSHRRKSSPTPRKPTVRITVPKSVNVKTKHLKTK